MNVYYARIRQFSEEEVQQAFKVLPKARIDKIAKIKQEKNRNQSITAGLLLEKVLQEKGLCGRELTFLTNADGKPYIKEYPDFYYNISHSEQYAALAVDEVPVGIDMERIRVGCKPLAERFFAADEIAFLQEHWSDSLFTKIWTRKESYLKASGYGMRMPLNGFSVVTQQVQETEQMNRDMLKGEAVYSLASICLEEEYWLSVCRKEKVGKEQNDKEEWKGMVSNLICMMN